VIPYVLLGIIALSTTIMVGITSFLVSLGMSLLTALSSIYLFAAIIMLMMIKSAKRLDDNYDFNEQGGHTKDQINSEMPVNNQIENIEAGVNKEVA